MNHDYNKDTDTLTLNFISLTIKDRRVKCRGCNGYMRIKFSSDLNFVVYSCLYCNLPQWDNTSKMGDDHSNWGWAVEVGKDEK
jgi:hypothetical protein